MGKLYYRYCLEFDFVDKENYIWDSKELLVFCNKYLTLNAEDVHFEEKPTINEINYVINQFKHLYKLYIHDYYKETHNQVVALEDIEEDIEVKEFYIYKKYYDNLEDYEYYNELPNLTERVY